MTFVCDPNSIILYILSRSVSMCGIYGITEKNKSWVNSYIKKCHYRGPDMNEIFCDENITLGHNLLSITDTPLQGAQPWKTLKGNILILTELSLVSKFLYPQPKV